MGVGLSTLAEEGSHEESFLEIYETKFTADVRYTFRRRNTGEGGKMNATVS